MKEKITVEALVPAPIEEAWAYWTEPAHIVKWNSASADWHTPRAVNDLRVGGRFSARMESRDGKEGFDFAGTYTEVDEHRKIAYAMDDGRAVTVEFIPEGDVCRITETFEAESENPIEMQRGGWQAILDSFKKYAGER
jgi:uncharacterized protein YndB with AHSA1/START domain